MTMSLQDAISLHQQGDFEGAAKQYKRILEVNPADVEILHLLAIVHGQLSQLNAAEAYIKKAITLAPQVSSLFNSYANIAKYKGDITEAESLYAKALSLAEYNPASHYNLGLIYLDNQQYTLAEQHLCKALAQKADYYEAYEVLIRYYQQHHQLSKAATLLETAQQYFPEHTVFLKLLAQQAHYQDQPLVAIERYESYLEQVFDDYDAHHHLGAAYLTQDEIALATKHTRTAIDIHPDHEESHHNLAVIYLTQNKLDLALEHWLHALRIRQHIDYFYNIGVVYNYKGHYTDALQYFEKCLSLDEEHYNSIVNIAVIYLKKHMPPEARLYFQKALAIKPDDEQNRYLVAALDNQQEHFDYAPQRYVTDLFNEYASTFDSHLTKVLRYKAPDVLYKLLQQQIDIEQAYDLAAVDIGCGTGLMGEKIHSHCAILIGIDLSNNMLEKARQKKYYTTLLHTDIIDYCQDSREPIDLITGADVLPYYGDLYPLLKALYTILKPGGHLIFSSESNLDTSSYHLCMNGRFQHSPEYVYTVVQNIGFRLVATDNTSTRHEGPVPIDCMTYLLQKPS